jgi:ABC-type phosphate/phosphonate transport system ATPase subunit
MDGIPVQIVEILKEEGSKKSNYKLNSEALSKILSQVNDKKVAVISIVGKSRRGKSFLLSYLIKYLSDSTNVNWVPNTDEPLLGIKSFKCLFNLNVQNLI